MDNIIDTINKVKTIDCTDINEAIDLLPEGDWYQSLSWLSFALHALRADIKRVYYTKGILKINASSTDPDFVEPIKWMCEGFSKYISRRCIVTRNASGVRRRDIDGWPCLSSAAYIEYLNLQQQKE